MNPSSAPASTYRFSSRALGQWSRDRLVFVENSTEKIRAEFRFEGCTCSNMGVPLSFIYRVDLVKAVERWKIDALTAEPAPGDEGHRAMCSAQEDLPRILKTIADFQPLRGEVLDSVLSWAPATNPAGCLCSATSRHHKWLIVLQTLHFTLYQKSTGESK